METNSLNYLLALVDWVFQSFEVILQGILSSCWSLRNQNIPMISRQFSCMLKWMYRWRGRSNRVLIFRFVSLLAIKKPECGWVQPTPQLALPILIKRVFEATFSTSTCSHLANFKLSLLLLVWSRWPPTRELCPILSVYK